MPESLSRRVLCRLAAQATAGGFLAACGVGGGPGGAGGTDARSAQPTVGPSQIVVHTTQSNANEAALYTERSAQFAERYPQIKLTIDVPTGDYYQKLTVLSASGSLGDSVRTHLILGGPALVAQKALLALDPFIAREKFDLNQYYRYAVEAFKREGKHYGLPFTGHAGRAIMFFNQTLLEQRGAGVPDKNWTLERLVDAARSVSGGGSWGYDPTAGVWQTPLAVVRSFGGELIDASGKQSLLNSPQAMAGITWLYECAHRHRITPTPAELAEAGGQPALFLAGKLAMVRSSLSFLNTTTRVGDSFKWFATLHPKGPANVPGSDSECGAFSITSVSKQPEATWLWVKFITDQETGIRLGEIGGVPGGRPDAYGSPRLVKDAVWKVFQEAMQIAQPARVPNNARMVEFSQAVAGGIKPLLDGTASPTRAFFDELHRQTQLVLDMPLP